MLVNFSNLTSELNDAIEHFKTDLKKIRSGKANAQTIESIMVEAYGGINPLNTVGQVQVEDAMNIRVSVWDKGVLPNVEKALREAETGGSVAVDKDIIRVKFMPMTEEDRKSRVKEVNETAENYRVRVRQVRQKFMKELESLEGVSEDEQERDSKQIQTKIDEAIGTIDTLAKEREEDLMRV